MTKDELLTALGGEHLASNPKIKAIAEAMSKITLEDLVHPETFALTYPGFQYWLNKLALDYYKSDYQLKAAEYRSTQQKLAKEQLANKIKAKADWISRNLKEKDWVKISLKGVGKYGAISDLSSKPGFLGIFLGDPLMGAPTRNQTWIPVSGVTHYLDKEDMTLRKIPAV